MKEQKTRVPKKQPEHKDIIGRPISIGDFVVFPQRNSLAVGKVIKLNEKMVKVHEFSAIMKGGGWGKINKYPSDVAIIEGEYLSMYILKNNA